MMKAHSHLSDDQLLELCLDESPQASSDELHGCASCEARWTELAALLDDVSEAMVKEADEAFPAERLARQQARILHRLQQDGRPGRLIAFPAHHLDRAVSRPRPHTRWIAAAAAAGLVIGLAAGHLSNLFPVRASAPLIVGARAPETGAPSLRAVATTFSEDEFLDQIDLAADSPGGSALRLLHDATPRAWEVK
jgi:hypothetical protein